MTGPFSLEGKICLVTGAARGIGESIAKAFADAGAQVVASDEVAIGWHHPRVRPARLDVREEAEWEAAMASLLADHGRLDVLVNNAGITGFENGPAAHDPEHASLEDWRKVHATNLDGVFLGCRHAIRAMRPHGEGAIINIGSRSGAVGIPAAAAYASSKAAIRNHTRTVALYCAEQGLRVRCNVIMPAAVLTPMWEPMLGDGPDRAERMAELVADTPLRRFADPAEVAALAVFLASDVCTYATGAEFHVDGGLLAGTAARPSR
jgi:NAD(P)-dependent dehydrogenase (short-subunit alcohol dehydrogenase family)